MFNTLLRSLGGNIQLQWNSTSSATTSSITTMAQARSKAYCSVPECFSYAQRQPYLHSHSFPANEEARKKWVRTIWRDEEKNLISVQGNICIHYWSSFERYQQVICKLASTENVLCCIQKLTFQVVLKMTLGNVLKYLSVLTLSKPTTLWFV